MKERVTTNHAQVSAREIFLFYTSSIVLFLFLISSNSHAQTTGSATLRGIIKDANGSVITKAVVTLRNEGTNNGRESVSDDEGGYYFTALTPGSYTVKVASPGFKTYEQSGITISPSDTRGLDVRLEVGSSEETVIVTALTAATQQETGAKEYTIGSNQIENLSIISRSSIELLRIIPGVAAPDQSQRREKPDGRATASRK